MCTRPVINAIYILISLLELGCYSSINNLKKTSKIKQKIIENSQQILNNIKKLYNMFNSNYNLIQYIYIY